jgi:hypothetical protein
VTTWQPWPPPTFAPSGFIVYFYPGDEDWPIVLQVAPEDAGNPGQPDVAEAEEARLPGDTESHVVHRDRGSGPWFFRWQHRLAGCTAGAWTDWWRGDPMVVDDVPPRPPKGSLGTPGLSVSQTSATFGEEEWTAQASPPPDLPGGALELRARQRREGEDWPDWGAWQAGTTLAETVSREVTRDRFVQFQARDTSLADTPESEAWTEKVKALVDLFDLPPLGRGPFEDDRARDGAGGEVPGDGRQKGRVYNRDGSLRMVDGVVGQERFRTGDLDQGITQSDGSANLALSKGRDPQGIRDGDSVTFGPNYQNTPNIEFGDGGGVRRTDAGWSGDGVEPGSYGPAFRAKNADADGYTAELILKEVDASATTRTISSWTVVTSGEELHADKTQTAEADDDKYTLRHHSFVPGNEFGGECFGSSQFVGYYFDKGSGWVKSHEKTYSSSCSDFDSDVSTDIVEDGIGDASGQGDSDNFRVLKEGGGGTISNPDFGNAVTWEEGANPKTTGATPSGSTAVPQVVESTSA